MRHWLPIAVLALIAWGTKAEQLAALEPGAEQSGVIDVVETFETAEWLWQATVRLEGDCTLELWYPARQRTARYVIEGPTDEPAAVSLHLRANPDASTHGRYRLGITWRLLSGEQAAVAAVNDVRVTPLYQHQIPRTNSPPVIDGDLSDACWNDAAFIGDTRWRMYNKPRDARMATEVWCCYDDENLYVAFRCETPDVRKLVSKIAVRDGFVWRDDSAEIFFDLGHDHDTYYEYIINPAGVVFDSKWFYEGGRWLIDWNYLGEWRTAIEQGAWIAEIRLALESYEERDLQGNPTGYMPLPTGDIAGILFSRNDRVVGEGMSHADNAPSFHEVHLYGHLVGFRPNRVEAYRRTALRELARLEERWERLRLAATKTNHGSLPPIAASVPATLTRLRARIEAPRPSFEEWVAIRGALEQARSLLAGAEWTLLDKLVRRPEAPWGVAAVPAGAGLPAGVSSLGPDFEWDRVRLSAARGEVEAVGLIPLSGGRTPPVSVEPSPLHGPGGSIPASCIRWYAVRDDRLVPEKPVRGALDQQIWWEVEVPRDARPGLYRGEIVTTDGEYRVALPIELTVYDFALPEVPSLAFSVSFDPQEVTRLWYGERGPLGTGEYWMFAEELLRHRVVPREMLADFTRWDDGKLRLEPAQRLAARVRRLGARGDGFVGARPEQLKGLADPGGVLDAALDRWQRLLGDRPLPIYLTPGTQVPMRLRTPQLDKSVAAIGAELPLPPAVEALGIWAVAPDVAVGLAGDPSVGIIDGAAITQAARELERKLAWRIEPIAAPIDLRMLGWLADEYGVRRIFIDEPEQSVEGAVASGLLLCLAQDGSRLTEPEPTVRLKMLREAVEDYEYVRMVKQLNGLLSRYRVGDKLWRLQLANATVASRNWDMVMNVYSYNRDITHLMQRRARIADQIMRSRDWLRRREPTAELPGDVPAIAP